MPNLDAVDQPTVEQHVHVENPEPLETQVAVPEEAPQVNEPKLDEQPSEEKAPTEDVVDPEKPEESTEIPPLRAEDVDKPSEAPAKKPRKKRTPKKKVVAEPVTPDEDDLDVSNLS